MPLLALTVIVGLAAYRAARLVAVDSILRRPRLALAVWINSGRSPQQGVHPMAELLTCPVCVGVWAAAAVAGWAWSAGLVHGWQIVLLVWWAGAGVAAILSQADLRMTR